MDHDELPGLGFEAGAAATCAACLETLGVPGHFALPVAAVAAVLARYLVQNGLPALARWWRGRRQQRRQGRPTGPTPP